MGFFIKFNTFERTMLIATGVCVAMMLVCFPIMTRLGMHEKLAVDVTLTFARSGGVIFFIALASATWRHMRPVRPGETPGEGAWDPAQAPRPAQPQATQAGAEQEPPSTPRA